MNVKDVIAQRDDICHACLVRHGFTDYMRDYEIVGEHWLGGRFLGKMTARFVGCIAAHYETTLTGPCWAASMEEYLIDYDAYKVRFDLGEAPNAAFVWGVKTADRPFWEYIDRSPDAKAWSKRLGAELHEVRVGTNAFVLRLIFHDLVVVDEPIEADTWRAGHILLSL